MKRKFCILENRQVLISLMKLDFLIGGESAVLCAEFWGNWKPQILIITKHIPGIDMTTFL
jgi:hypothetical protein